MCASGREWAGAWALGSDMHSPGAAQSRQASSEELRWRVLVGDLGDGEPVAAEVSAATPG